MADHIFAETTQCLIFPHDGHWGKKCEKNHHNMDLLWNDVCDAALRLGFIKDVQLQEFQSSPRKPFGVTAKNFLGVFQRQWRENGVWLVAYPLLTADDKTWIARLDVFYTPTDGDHKTYEYVKGPVLTIQHRVEVDEDHDFWDYVSLVYDRKSENLRPMAGGHLDEIDLVRHIANDVDRNQHKNILPRKLTAKEIATAEQARLESATSSIVQKVQKCGKKKGKESSKASAVGSQSRKRQRRVILEDSEDEHAASNPSGSSSSGHQAAAATDGSGGGMSAEANAAPGDESSKGSGQRAGNEELEKALQKVKALEAKVRQQELQIARPSSTTTDTGAHTRTEGNPTPGDASGEQQTGDGEPEKTPRRMRTLEDMVRQQGVEITELKLRLADGMGQ